MYELEPLGPNYDLGKYYPLLSKQTENGKKKKETLTTFVLLYYSCKSRWSIWGLLAALFSPSASSFSPQQKLINEVFKDWLSHACLLHKPLPEKLYQLEMPAIKYKPHN